MLKQEIFKANDIRGVIAGPDPEWDILGAKALGAAYVGLLGLAGKSFVIGRDMRLLGAELSAAFIEGASAQGASVVDIGLSSTDQLWFASGKLGLPGVQFTASHNPSRYNGIKFCLKDAAPVPGDFMMDLALAANQKMPDPVEQKGGYEKLDLLHDYGTYLRSLVCVDDRRRLRVVADAGNGMAGHTIEEVFAGLNVELIGLYLDLDGSFPNHPANPLEPANLVDARNAVVEAKADLALVFDGDADRCFIIDETGGVVDPSALTALIAEEELRKEPGGTIIINSITSTSVKDLVERVGGKLVTSRVGHTYVKAKMAEYSAIFGGEHSAHYYFRDFWGADTGMLAALHVMAMLSRTDLPLSALVAQYDLYRRSGELNSVVKDAQEVIAAVSSRYSAECETDLDDGLTVRGGNSEGISWWFNLRPSNTEPLLRLNVEANDEATMQKVRDDVLAAIKEADRSA